ncbi:Ribosomal protein S1-like1 [Cocos nucifera]|uniref:Ribosomal protein S1-like1 n=1 Tax=Cocos nucifera TaxID=13894 RepID=A0A8K0N3F6_COCNU|nr:Ribosomal protein S1-like1 [Cocos nucifera]
MAALTKKKAPQKKRPINGTKPHKPFKKPGKEKTRPPTPSELSSSLFVQDDDPDFPRGGASVLTREEVAEARAEAEEEFERESKKSKDTRKKKGTKKSLVEAVDDFGSLFGDGVTGKLPRFANRITLKNISPRMKLWGVIIEVNTKDLVIGLPGGLRGYVRAEEVSDFIIDDGNKDSESNLLCSKFHVGQLVSCIVVRVDDDKKDGKGNRRIWLSLRLSLLYKGLTLDAVQDGMVLTAQIKSIADHGYILYFGTSSFTGFLPKSEQDGGVFSCGQHLQCVVKSIDNARAVAIVNSDADLVSKSAMKDLKGLSIDLLVPGMMVNARVHSTFENGILLSFLTYFTGTVNARILFIDPSTRAVGLTLNPYLVQNTAPPAIVRTGEIYDNSRILMVDRGIGLVLEVPSSPIPSPAYVSISDVSDAKVTTLEKRFKEGDYVRVCVLGMRHLDGLAMGTLRASAFEGSVFTHSDVKPGMLVNAKVGSELLFRVLGCKSKRITVTHKKTLVKSKLPVLASYADATEGLIVHGWITKIEKHGCFVRSSENDIAKLGSIVSGVVERLMPAAVIIHVNGNAYLKGTLFDEHLADHQGQAVLLKSLLRPGYQFDQLLVLDTEGQNLIFSAKYSLINYAKEIPSDLSQIHPSSVVNGYICNIIENGCFVRFLGRLTGFSPKDKVTDQQIDNLSDAFYVGQSVRSHVLTFNGETGRLKLSLKQSLCSSSDVSFIHGYFLLEEKIAALQMSVANNSDSSWTRSFGIGSLVEGEIQEIKEFGVVASFRDHVGGINVEVGSVVKALVLDIAKSDGLVDLSLKPELVTSACVDRAKKKRRRSTSTDLQLHQTVNAVVEIVKENYLVLSIPEYNYAIGYASITDYNMQMLPRKHFLNGQRSYLCLSQDSFGVLDCVFPHLSKHKVAGKSIKIPAAEDINFSVGSIVRGYVVKVDGEWVWLTMSRSVMAHIFVLDSSCEPGELQEFQQWYSVGQAVKGKVISINKEKKLLRLASCPSSFVSGSSVDHEIVKVDIQENKVSNVNCAEHIFQGDIVGGKVKRILPGVSGLLVQIGPHLFGKVHYTELVDAWVPQPLSGYHEGQFVKCGSTVLNVQGYVKNVTSKGCFIMLSRMIDARILLSNLSDGYIENPEKEFLAGKLVLGRVLSVDPALKRVEVTLKTDMKTKGEKSDASDFCNLHVSDVISGRIRRIEPYGLFIAIDNTNVVGLCHKSELSDELIDNIETRYQAGDRVVAKVLKVDEERHRISLGMKKSYIENASNGPIISNHGTDGSFNGIAAVDDTLQQNDDLPHTEKMFGYDNKARAVLEQAETRASVLPLQVVLDDSDGSDLDNVTTLKKHAPLQEGMPLAVWLHCVQSFLKQGKDGIQSIVNHALLSLPRNKHIKFISQTAILEFKFGVPDRGRSMFEGILREYPKRTDLWSIYLDQEIRLGDVEVIRALFGRATFLSLPPKKMKFLFKKYVEYEKAHGDEDRIEHVKKRALEYVESSLA